MWSRTRGLQTELAHRGGGAGSEGAERAHKEWGHLRGAEVTHGGGASSEGGAD